MFDLMIRGPPSVLPDRNRLVPVSALRNVLDGDTTAHCVAEDTVFIDHSKSAPSSFVVQSRRMSASPSPPATPTPFMSSTPFPCNISSHEGTGSHRSLQDELIAAVHLDEPRASDELNDMFFHSERTLQDELIAAAHLHDPRASDELDDMFFHSERTMTLRALQDELLDVAPCASGGIASVRQDTGFVYECSRGCSLIQDTPEYGKPHSA
ncbi:hypothetical protein BV25DRAFT_1921468 [Artomyces pyxidatus]|uniref:Uncharacterized protein n=1 Tax=Artomyces pyxidatus TaxID=48021 RepID=A0ACB8SIT1_9AGAM|nr:hypothetical protein BV25DRAFT_1921468 [Artomyces pyxidatus]